MSPWSFFSLLLYLKNKNYKTKFRELIPPEVNKQGPVCMNQYKWMFGVTRVPKPECDELVGGYPAKSRHIIVHAKDQIFVVEVYDSKTGARLMVSDIER